MAPRTIEEIMEAQRRVRQDRSLSAREAFEKARSMSIGGAVGNLTGNTGASQVKQCRKGR